MVAYYDSTMDAVFKALADASRRELLDRLRADNGQTLNDLCARLDMTRQAVSKHLAILEDANLVATVKAAGAQEKDILVQVTQARAGANQVKLSGDQLTDPAKMQAFERAQGAVTLSLQRLQEAYPELKSQGNYTTLMSQLEGTENRITIARTDYNNAVQAYNTKIRTFPDAVGAKIFYGAKPLTPFAATTPGADQAPTVNFGNAS